MDQTRERAVIGRTIAGKFLIESFIGEGAMGAVYKARQLALDKIVAIKVLHADRAGDALHSALFQREAKAASRLDHPNSVRVVDFGLEPDGLLYIAMEYFAGRDLHRVLAEDWPLSAYRVADILSQALAAIAVAHEMGMVHRDLKPENILVQQGHDDEGATHDVVKVCDFGIAKFTDAGEAPLARPGRYLTEGLLFGTPHYMSPEQAQGESLDARTDLYSMGVILYQMLTSRVPFDGKTLVDVVIKHVQQKPVPPRREAPWVDARLETVCLKALSKQKDKRYQSAREMRADLRAVMSAPASTPALPRAKVSRDAPTFPPGDSQDASTVTPAPTLTKPRRSWHRARWGFAAVVPVATVGAVLWMRPWHPSARVASSVPAQVAFLEDSEATATIAPVDVVAPARSVPTHASVATPAPVVAAPPRGSGRTTPRATTKAPPAPSPDEPASAPAADSSIQANKKEPSESASPALLAEATGTANSTVLPTAPAAAATVPTAARPSRFDPSHARVVWSVGETGGGTTAADVRRALSRISGAWTACYQNALRMSGQRVEGSGILRLATDEEGNVVQANVTGFTLPTVPTCIASSARVRIDGVDTGSAWAEVKLLFRAEPSE